MTSLIAGGCGFIGLAMAEHLLAAGEDVVLFDRNDLHPVAKRCFDGLPGTYTLVRGDIREEAPIAQAIGDHKVKHIYYGAAVTSGDDREREFPELTIQVNLVGLAHALKASAKAGVERVINISSGAAYGHGAFGDTGWDGPLDEYGTREDPIKIYGMTKFGSERLTRRYAYLSGMSAVSVRLSTIWGPWEIDSGMRDTLSAPMQTAKLARAGKAVILPRKDHLDWTYSRHVAGALKALMTAPGDNLKSDIFNVTSARQIATLDMCPKLAAAYPAFSYKLAEPGDTPTVNLWGDADRFPMKPDRLADEAGHRLPDNLDATMDDFVVWLADFGDFWGDS
jgi:nucleoside-diphosphate-sugar epimerase